MDSLVLFALLVGVFLLGLAVFAAALYWFSRKARREFGGVGSRLSEVSYYLHEFSKAAAKIRVKASEKATAAFVEKKLVGAAREIEEEREMRRERERLVAVRLASKKKQKD